MTIGVPGGDASGLYLRLGDLEKQPAPSAPRDHPLGPYFLWTADDNGRTLNEPADGSHPPQDRADERARDIVFSTNPAGSAPDADDIEVCDRTDRMLHALRHLYPPGKTADEADFRWFYVRLYGLARMRLEAKQFTAEIAKRELTLLENDLIEDAGPRIKRQSVNAHLRCAAKFSIPVGMAFATLRLAPTFNQGWLAKFGADSVIAGNLMLLLLGCFIGVCLAYAWRKPEFAKVDDLVKPESDLLAPWMRLSLASAISVLLVLIALAGIADFEFGSVKLSHLRTMNNPALPFIVGAFFGMFEKVLPETLISKAPPLLAPAPHATAKS
jgi:hypothetical protein